MLKPLILLVVVLMPLSACAGWPDRVFAPYMYVGSGDDFKLTECDDATGLKHYTLAFIIAKQEGRGRDVKYLTEPSWDGRVAMGQDFCKDQIDAIRQRGGDVIISFGGEAGREIAIVIEDPKALEAAYQSIIDRYKFTWLDFDIEGENLEKYRAASERRNSVLAALQKKNPGLMVSYTLPVSPDGVSKASQSLLADAKAKGMKVHSANLMVMYFGKRFIHKGRSEGELGVDSAKKAHEQIQAIDAGIQIGLCPCLGRNGSADEVFTVDDARTLKTFADQTPWVCSLHFWSINGDSGRRRRSTSKPTAGEPWAFTSVFKSFTSTKR